MILSASLPEINKLIEQDFDEIDVPSLSSLMIVGSEHLQVKCRDLMNIILLSDVLI